MLYTVWNGIRVNMHSFRFSFTSKKEVPKITYWQEKKQQIKKQDLLKELRHFIFLILFDALLQHFLIEFDSISLNLIQCKPHLDVRKSEAASIKTCATLFSNAKVIEYSKESLKRFAILDIFLQRSKYKNIETVKIFEFLYKEVLDKYQAKL
jgi:hypothetical protein